MSFDGYIDCGLKPEAAALIRGLPNWKVGVIDHDPMYDPGGVRVRLYIGTDGRVFAEDVQETPMYQGDMAAIFMALKDRKGHWVSESLWSPGEISLHLCRMESQSLKTVEGKYWVEGRWDQPSGPNQHQPVFRLGVVRGKTIFVDGKVQSIDEYVFVSAHYPGHIGPWQWHLKHRQIQDRREGKM